MKKFIAKSEISKKILKIAQMSSNLPVNILITGEIGTGKKVLAKEILPNSFMFKAKELEDLINSDKINLKDYKSLIILNINEVSNKTKFLNKLDGIKLVATGYKEDGEYLDKFAIKIDIPPLVERKEDLEELVKIYVKEANQIFATNIDTKNLKLNLSKNGQSLKQSIFKNTIFQSIKKEELISILQDFFIKELEKEKSYKELIEIFEKPLLKAAKAKFKSQLQMAKKLDINRNTLRTKIKRYFNG